jgi:hypothetical protein
MIKKLPKQPMEVLKEKVLDAKNEEEISMENKLERTQHEDISVLNLF